VIWAILALLGVPLWLIALAIMTIIYRNRSLRGRPNNVSVRMRKAPGKRWTRGNGVWLHDVFAFRGSPAAWRDSLLWVSAAASKEPEGDDAHKLRRMSHPILAVFLTQDGDPVQVAADGRDQALLLGPFDDRVRAV
jgi:hypothetical protein